MDAVEIISAAYAAFATFERPSHFTDHKCCPECAEHDDTLRHCELREIGSCQVGTVGWSPIPFLTPEAYGYVMPRLLEMALSGGKNKDGDFFLFQYLLAVSPNPEHRNLDYFTPDQAAALLQSLKYIRENLAAEVHDECCEEDLAQAIDMWESRVRKSEART